MNWRKIRNSIANLVSPSEPQPYQVCSRNVPGDPHDYMVIARNEGTDTGGGYMVLECRVCRRVTLAPKQHDLG